MWRSGHIRVTVTIKRVEVTCVFYINDKCVYLYSTLALLYFNGYYIITCRIRISDVISFHHELWFHLPDSGNGAQSIKNAQIVRGKKSHVSWTPQWLYAQDVTWRSLHAHVERRYNAVHDGAIRAVRRPFRHLSAIRRRRGSTTDRWRRRRRRRRGSRVHRCTVAVRTIIHRTHNASKPIAAELLLAARNSDDNNKITTIVDVSRVHRAHARVEGEMKGISSRPLSCARVHLRCRVGPTRP